MTDYHIDLRKFHPSMHRIVKAWYFWQEVDLRKRGRYPGQEKRTPEPWETAEQVFWGARPPEMVSESELAFFENGDAFCYIVCEDGVYYIDEQERGSRGRYWMFRNLEDAEKCILFILSQRARPGSYSDSPRSRWYKQGLDARVFLSQPDPVNYPGRVSMTVDHELVDRGWLGENDAVPFSHAIVQTYDELDANLREGISEDWFDLNLITDF
ncbi:hypothetical protein [Candidatus Mycobacterium methanotrophicum]|uniref:Uncharacterized protein n=1 Tax=Candidatus Mycobacterium methanotrophicum TaxID=2943498 RepID=A0ABY4QQF4_9MYCO|nr:hypothetical protein [Candidatus Mycobacterium methanotrophicum]UQX12009.1 hypothetical protein M5I08_06575 [Candidatus Mycobacterium methanotrophicum]